MPAEPAHRPLEEAAGALGDRGALDLLKELVAIHPTNLEDPIHGRFEKPRYPDAAEAIARRARAWGLEVRRYDPTDAADPEGLYRGVRRPNVVVDLDRGARERVLVLAHYDVVPVPAEQRPHWLSPPDRLTHRADGRLYGRGANDDLGSGVVAGLLAMRRLKERPRVERNVRLLACCDEETGGLGGIEALRRRDEELAEDDPARIVAGEVALIPDGSPHATAASSGLVFVDARLDPPSAVAPIVDLGRALVGLHELASGWRSTYASPDWPDHDAPAPVITGRATLTRFDVEDGHADPRRPSLVAAHAENDAPNQIAERVTLAFAGGGPALKALPSRLAELLPPPYRLAAPAEATALRLADSWRSVQVVGRGAHGGYPHRAWNPVPASLDLLARAIDLGLLSTDIRARASFSLDLRLPPELPLEQGRGAALERLASWTASSGSSARIDAPLTRARGGYSVAPEDPQLRRLERLTSELLGEPGVYGEYGGTDASSLQGLRSRSGRPLVALVFGSMDRSARIHEAEESVDPRRLAGVATTIERFVAER